MRHFYSSFIITCIGLTIAFYIGKWEAMYICILLSILEVSLSFDNAVVNAKVLHTMDKKWQQRFIYWGIPIAVFGMRFVFPIVIVAIAARMGVVETLHLALYNPEQYHKALETTRYEIYAFGAGFLLMVFLHFFFDEEKDALLGYLFIFLFKEYKKRNIIVQLHFSVTRNINSEMFKKIGPDAGFDVIGKECDLNNCMKFLDKLSDEERPVVILYTLNPNQIAPLSCISGAFRNVLIGAAWWFNDTLLGIRRNLELVSEYACIGTNLGMLTDSRSFSSYSRFDFFRRILANFVAEKVEAGEYELEDAKTLVKNISYYNIKGCLGI